MALVDFLMEDFKKRSSQNFFAKKIDKKTDAMFLLTNPISPKNKKFTLTRYLLTASYHGVLFEEHYY